MPSMRKDLVNVRLDPAVLRRVDEAVARGAFASRSEAIREMVGRFLGDHPELFHAADLTSLLRGSRMEDEEFTALMTAMLRGLEAAGVVAEGRDRF